MQQINYYIKNHNNITVKRLWQENGHLINISDYEYRNLLFNAVESTNHDIIQFLVNTCGYDVNYCDSEGNTALIKSINIVRRFGCDKKYASLMTLVASQYYYYSNIECVKILLDIGADQTIRNNKGKCAYDIALKELKYLEFVDSKNVDSKNSALIDEYREIVELLDIPSPMVKSANKV
jgi:ankyrin repeat protein